MQSQGFSPPEQGAGLCVPLGGLASTSQISPFRLSLPVCNNDGGAVCADLGQGSLDVPLSLCVKCRCGLRGETQHGEGIEAAWAAAAGLGEAGLGPLLLPHPAG